MDLELLVTLLDLAGTFAFALVGARIAANKGLDYGGIAFIAAIASRGNSWVDWRSHRWLIARCTLPGRTSFTASRNNWNFLPSRIAGLCQL